MRIYGKRPKRGKTYEAHTEPTKYGMGDYYGRGVRAPIGKLRSDTVGYRPMTPKKLKTAPRGMV